MLYNILFVIVLLIISILVSQIKTRRYKKEIKQQNLKIEKLLNLSDQKDQFLANTSHELKTPIHGIIGISDSLISGAIGEISETLYKNLKLISSSSKRLSLLINDLLDFSQLKKEKLNLNKSDFNIYNLSSKIIEILEFQIMKKNIKIINNIPKEEINVFADKLRIEQVLYNIIGNAIKFMPKGQIIIKSNKENKHLAISVIDTGPGIPPNKFDEIFLSFVQLEKNHNRIHSGTGLGLAISKSIIEQNGGTIRVESELRVGSKFTFTIPLSNT